MKEIKIILYLLVYNFAFGQPDPREKYPQRIKEITEQLVLDSLNYDLIWERLEMKVNLMQAIQSNSSETFANYCKKIDCKSFEKDFNKVYENIIKLKKFAAIEEGEYYLNRMWYYTNSKQLDKAINDALYLRDKASYSQYYERGEYYNDWAVSSLFNLYILKEDYENALQTINFKLEKQKYKNPKLYYSGVQNSYYEKLELYEHFDKKWEIVSFLKQLCHDNFQQYFKIAKFKYSDFNHTLHVSDNEYYDSKGSYIYFLNEMKELSYSLLKQLVDSMKKYNDKELAKYEKVYNQLRYNVRENYETVNPDINDEKLQSIILGI